jgi:hypothetical protein
VIPQRVDSIPPRIWHICTFSAQDSELAQGRGELGKKTQERLEDRRSISKKAFQVGTTQKSRFAELRKCDVS